eukprot:CAMPEP_0181173464 /NCGR_PEP_ID=MMETSP1096-20121128/3015_1 /TAXON_ID=156174 ORGANISM="Chrysochromulina ericina, Strain CCMP281" /NCGR_SAMPLE_ID=MMETSP1096 /ASSEMBLY_ACC=CAM_ASM_000453 /LENGTH=204 /DNA_ID=CAMNT_0023261297 /DNA_START=189 /DNA_END=804 /DNA_ORIENTATION=+
MAECAIRHHPGSIAEFSYARVHGDEWTAVGDLTESAALPGINGQGGAPALFTNAQSLTTKYTLLYPSASMAMRTCALKVSYHSAQEQGMHTTAEHSHGMQSLSEIHIGITRALHVNVACAAASLLAVQGARSLEPAMREHVATEVTRTEGCWQSTCVLVRNRCVHLFLGCCEMTARAQSAPRPPATSHTPAAAGVAAGACASGP